jgi:acyl carrier protein
MSAIGEIDTRVERVLAEALNADEGEITPEATLRDDLGAESIDFLDIVFRLEREFDIRIPSGELFPDSIFRSDPAFVQDGRVTDQGLAELHARMPYADLSGFERDRRVSAVPDLFTVALITRYVAWKLHPEAAADRGGHAPTPAADTPSGLAEGRPGGCG